MAVWSRGWRSPPTVARPGTRPPGRPAGPTAGWRTATRAPPSGPARSTTAATSRPRRRGSRSMSAARARSGAPASTPGQSDSGSANAVEVGVKFRSEVSGRVTGVRFYKGSRNTGTHVGNLWTASGTKLASVTFSNETSSGWQQATFAQPGGDQREHHLRRVVLRPGRAHGPGRLVHVPESVTDPGRLQPRGQSSAARSAQRQRHGERDVPEQQHEHVPDEQPGRAELLGRRDVQPEHRAGDRARRAHQRDRHPR